MQILQSLLTIVCLLSWSLSFGQNIPIDFEEDGIGADWNWRTFENVTDPPLEIIDNPDASGINVSEQVVQFTALEGGMPFAGFESMHGTDIGDFVINESNAIIRIMVHKPVISDVGIKLVRADNWSLGEIKIPNTKINEWEQLSFDFTSHIGNPYDQIVIFPDFDTRDSDHIIYIDNIYGDVATPSSTHSDLSLDISLFPNPADDLLYVNVNDEGKTYKIYTIAGELVKQANLSSSVINIQSLEPGLYYLKVVDNKGYAVNTFIKQ